jgi:hypothetical protein
MVQPRDAAAVRAFLADCGVGIGELNLARLLHFDPRRHAVICASALVSAHEAIVAVGAIDLDASSPDLVLVADDPDGALRTLLTGALCGRAPANAA